jgi:hypothetical protein
MLRTAKNVAAYIRDDGEMSEQAQRKALQKFCRKNALKICAFYIDEADDDASFRQLLCDANKKRYWKTWVLYNRRVFDKRWNGNVLDLALKGHEIIFVKDNI